MATSSKKTVTTKTTQTASKTSRKTASKRTPAAPRKAAPQRKPAPTAPVKQASAPAEAKAAKPKKPKLVRDSFTIPKTEYAALDTLKLRAAKLAHPVKKSELLRAGIMALGAMADAALLTALRAVPPIKTGRPKKD